MATVGGKGWIALRMVGLAVAATSVLAVLGFLAFNWAFYNIPTCKNIIVKLVTSPQMDKKVLLVAQSCPTTSLGGQILVVPAGPTIESNVSMNQMHHDDLYQVGYLKIASPNYQHVLDQIGVGWLNERTVQVTFAGKERPCEMRNRLGDVTIRFVAWDQNGSHAIHSPVPCVGD